MACPQAAQDLEAVDIRQSNVEHDQIELLLGEHPVRVLAAACVVDSMPCPGKHRVRPSASSASSSTTSIRMISSRRGRLLPCRRCPGEPARHSSHIPRPGYRRWRPFREH